MSDDPHLPQPARAAGTGGGGVICPRCRRRLAEHGYNVVGCHAGHRVGDGWETVICDDCASHLGNVWLIRAQGVLDFNGATTRPTVDVAAPMLGGDEG